MGDQDSARPGIPSLNSLAGIVLVELARIASARASRSSSANRSRFASTRSGPLSCTQAAPETASASDGATAIRASTALGTASPSSPAAASSGSRAAAKSRAACAAPPAGSHTATECPARANTIAQERPISPAPTTAVFAMSAPPLHADDTTAPGPRAIAWPMGCRRTVSAGRTPSWSAKADRPRLFAPTSSERCLRRGRQRPGTAKVEKGGWLYLMTNRPNGTLIGRCRRTFPTGVREHREGIASHFTQRYGLRRLVYAEGHDDIRAEFRGRRPLRVNGVPGRCG